MMSTKAKVTEKFTITGDWTKLAKLLKEKYSQVTDADLKFETGMEDELLNRLQRRLSRNRDGIIEVLNALDPLMPAVQTVRR
jgi:hypothetical protein